MKTFKSLILFLLRMAYCNLVPRLFTYAGEPGVGKEPGYEVGHIDGLRLCSHDAGTGRKRREKVTFSLSVHTMPVRNCTIPSQNNAGFQTA